MLLDFWKRRRAAASAALEPFAKPSDEELAGWLAHIATPEVPGRHPYAQVSTR